MKIILESCPHPRKRGVNGVRARNVETNSLLRADNRPRAWVSAERAMAAIARDYPASEIVGFQRGES